jgi:hypothetical protein
MTNKISVLRASLTGVAGLVGAGVAVVVVAAVCLLPLPSYSANVTAVEVSPIPGEQTRVCSGPLLQVMSQLGDASNFVAVGAPDILTQSSGATVATRDLNAVDVQESGSTATPQVVSVEAAGAEAPQPLIAATQLQQVATEDLAGLATAPCMDATSDAWLVGGATDVGRTTLVLLSNPTEVTANVSLEIFGDNGAVSAPGADALVVEPGEQRVVSLAAYAPDLLDPVVHVTSQGGQVLASLQQSVTRTLVPSGVDIITPSAGPNTTQVITGVSLTGLAAQARDEASVVSSDLESTMRVVVPGSESADITMTVIGVSGKPIEITTTLAGQHTIQLPFTGLTDGVYTVIVSADKPIVAGVRSVQAPSGESVRVVAETPAATTPPPPAAGGGEGFNGQGTTPQTTTTQPTITSTPTLLGGDFAWHTSALPLTGDTLIPVAAGPNPVLSLYNPTNSPITAILASVGQQNVTVLVPAGGMATTAVTPASKYTLKETTSLHAALTYSAPGNGAAVAVNPTNQRGATIKVYPR